MKEFSIALTWIVLAAVGGNVGLWLDSMEERFRGLATSWDQYIEAMTALGLDLKELSAHVILATVALQRLQNNKRRLTIGGK